MNTLMPNLILESITKIHESKEKLLRQPDLLIEIKSDMDDVSQFLELDNKMFMLVSVIICEQLMGEVVSIRKMMKLMGFDPIDIIKRNESIKILKKEVGYLFLKEEFILLN